MHLNPFAISNLFIIVTLLPFSFFLSIKGKTPVAKLYFYCSCCTLIWGTGAFIATTTPNQNMASLFLRVAYCGVIFIPVFVERSIHFLLNKKSKLFLLFAYLQANKRK